MNVKQKLPFLVSVTFLLTKHLKIMEKSILVHFCTFHATERGLQKKYTCKCANERRNQGALSSIGMSLLVKAWFEPHEVRFRIQGYEQSLNPFGLMYVPIYTIMGKKNERRNYKSSHTFFFFCHILQLVGVNRKLVNEGAQRLFIILKAQASPIMRLEP